MTPQVKRIDVAQVINQGTTANPAVKAETEKEQVDAEIQKALLGNSTAQKERQAELQKEYTTELTMDEKDAKKAAKVRVQDEVTAERIDNTTVYYDKAEYEKVKTENDKKYEELYDQYRDQGNSKKQSRALARAEAGEVEYVKNKKVRSFVEANKDKFFDEEGKFDQDKYKEEINNWSGDNKLDLSESRAAGSQYQVKAKTIRKAASYANFDVQNDKTALKRTLHVAECAGIGAAIGAGTGAILGKYINKSTPISGSGSGSKFVQIPFEGGIANVTVGAIAGAVGKVTTPIGSTAGALMGAITGGAGGLGAGLATMGKIKDQGEKDVFNGIGAEAVVKEGAKGIDGIANAKLVNGILKMENLTDDQKVNIFKNAYGENTGKRVTQRELLAAYEEAKELNQKTKPVVTPPPVVTTPITTPPVTVPPECPKTPGQDVQVVEKELPSTQYKPKYGEYWAGIIKAKYGIKPGKELKEAVHELKKQHGINNFNLNTQPKVMNLPDELNGHKLNIKNKVKDKATKFAPSKKYTGSYVNPKTQERVPVYFYTDCNGNRSPMYSSPQERDNALNSDKTQKAA